MTAHMAGGCACGSVRFDCTEKPIVQLICHCRDCQRASGSSFAAVMFVPSDRLTFTKDAPLYHEVTAASGRKLQRGFCGKCGSPVSLRWPDDPFQCELLVVSSLDDPSVFAPSYEVWTSRAGQWHAFNPDTIKFEKGPSAETVLSPIKAYFSGRDAHNAVGA